MVVDFELRGKVKKDEALHAGFGDGLGGLKDEIVGGFPSRVEIGGGHIVKIGPPGSGQERQRSSLCIQIHKLERRLNHRPNLEVPSERRLLIRVDNSVDYYADWVCGRGDVRFEVFNIDSAL